MTLSNATTGGLSFELNQGCGVTVWGETDMDFKGGVKGR
jgi:hypothetical protein